DPRPAAQVGVDVDHRERRRRRRRAPDKEALVSRRSGEGHGTQQIVAGPCVATLPIGAPPVQLPFSMICGVLFGRMPAVPESNWTVTSLHWLSVSNSTLDPI